MKQSKVFPNEDKSSLDKVEELDLSNFEKSVDFSKSKKRAYLSTLNQQENEKQTEEEEDNLFSIKEEEQDEEKQVEEFESASSYSQEEEERQNVEISEADEPQNNNQTEEDIAEIDDRDESQMSNDQEQQTNKSISKTSTKISDSKKKIGLSFRRAQTKQSRVSKNNTAKKDANDSDNNSLQEENECKDNFIPEIDNQLSENSDEMNDIIDMVNENGHLNKSLRQDERYKDVKWIIFPDDPFRGFWDMMLVLVLSYTCVITPYRIAFIMNDDSVTWQIIDYTTDSIFALDVLINFFTAYYDYNDNLITAHKKIASNYLTGWFGLDIIGVFPFDKILNTNRYGNLARVARLPRLYKLVKLTKFLRVMKLIKERNKVIKYIISFLKVGPGFERLIMSLISIFMFCHMAACFWYMVADLNDDRNGWIFRFDYLDRTTFEKYIAAFYWITQTVVTVGYGDINCGNTLERAIACLLMFVGVFFYSFTIGSLSSLLSNLDSKNAHFDQKMNTLVQIRNQYGINNLLYNRIKRALKYGHVKTDTEKINLLNQLPLNLRIELSVIMHQNLVSGIEFFKKKPARFIAFIGPFLKIVLIGKDEYVFTEGEYADEMYFIKSGQVSMVLRQYGNFQFMTIDQGYYFGEVDILFGETRKYTYMADDDCELLSLHKKHFTKIFFNEFREIGSEIYKNALKRRIRQNKVYRDAVQFCENEELEKQKKHTKQKKISLFEPQYSLANNQNRYSSIQESELKELKQELQGGNKNQQGNDNDKQQISNFARMLGNSQFFKETAAAANFDNFKQDKNQQFKTNQAIYQITEIQKRVSTMEGNITEILNVYKNLGIEIPPEAPISNQENASPTISYSKKSPSLKYSSIVMKKFKEDSEIDNQLQNINEASYSPGINKKESSKFSIKEFKFD